VFVAADEASFAQFVIDPTVGRAGEHHIDIRGDRSRRPLRATRRSVHAVDTDVDPRSDSRRACETVGDLLGR
jgi:hypothetical protein